LDSRLNGSSRECNIKPQRGERSSARRTLLHNSIAYAIAIAIVWYAARGVSWTQIARALGHATLWLFICASSAGFLCWFIGETLLYSRLFTFFHGPTRSSELLPTMGAMYFLQIVNSWVAGGALLLFLHSRKRVPWMTAGCTLLFQAYVDAMTLATLSVFSILLLPASVLRPGLWYAIGVVLGGCLIGWFFLGWGKWLNPGNPLRWIHDLTSMMTFRLARPSQFIRLAAIRSALCAVTGLTLYGQFVSFHLQVPLIQALALSPIIVAIGNSPFSPGGIGTTQLVLIFGFAAFAGKGDLFAISLAITVFNLLVRIPMGLAMREPIMETEELANEQSKLAATLQAG
jgi:uncharacterized membrane protein YbhN (UPF0104 family)